MRKFAKFVHDASFQQVNNSGAEFTVLTTSPEQSNFPRFSLSCPVNKPYSEELKEHAISRALSGLSAEKAAVPEENDNLGFFQATNVTEFLKVGYERKNLRLGNFEFNDVDVNAYGSKILLAGSDQTVHNFLQEYVPAMQSLVSVKNSILKRNTQVFLVPGGQNTLCNYLA